MFRVLIAKPGQLMTANGVGRTVQGAALTSLRLFLYLNDDISVIEARGALSLAMKADRQPAPATGAHALVLTHKASSTKLEITRISIVEFNERLLRQERGWKEMEQ